MPKNMADGLGGRGSRIYFADRMLCEKIREAYDQGYSLRAIEMKLNRDGVRTPYGGKWTHNGVRGAVVQAGGTIRTLSQQKVLNGQMARAAREKVVPKR